MRRAPPTPGHPSNLTRTAPPVPDKLERVIGCGSSSALRYEGTGAYFLEKLAEGSWRLEVYPDAVWVNDPYGTHSLSREVVRLFWREWPMEIRLGDLGDDFTVEPLSEGNQVRGRAAAGTCRLRPGVYLLQRSGVTSAEWKEARLPHEAGLREFFALPGKAAPTVVRHEPVPGWVEGKALPVSFTVATPQEPDAVALEFNGAASEAPRPLPVKREGAFGGANVPLTTDWGEARLPLSSLRLFAHLAGNPPNRGGAEDRIRPQDIAGVSVCFGAWLYPAHAAEPHTVEIEAIEVE